MKNHPYTSENSFLEIHALEAAVEALSLKGLILLKLNSDGDQSVSEELIHSYPGSAGFITSQYLTGDLLNGGLAIYKTGNENNDGIHGITNRVKPINPEFPDLAVFTGVLTSSEEGKLACIYFKEGENFTEPEKACLSGMIKLAAETIRQKSALEMLQKENKITAVSPGAKPGVTHQMTRDKSSDTFKSAFLAGISHEIRTPMNHILGFLDLLSEPDISASEKADFMKIMKSSGMKLLHLIDDVIELGFIDSGQVTIREEKCNLNLFMESLFDEAERLRASLPEKNVCLKLNLNNKTDQRFILTDEIRIRQIMNNLVSNALKFTLEGEVEIGYRIKDDEKIEFYVRDTGIGIAPVDQEVIFERFKRLENGLYGSSAGVGLGLSICQGIASLLDSEILVSSAPGKGSTFSFMIPLVRSEDPVQVKPPEVAGNYAYNWSGKTVLIVEDDLVNLRFLTILLAKTHIHMLYASDGKQAVEMVEKLPVDLILMDMNLPVMNGYESTRKIKKLRPELPIIAQTAHAMRGDRLECLQAGCDEYLAKPLEMDKFYTMVNRFLKNGS